MAGLSNPSTRGAKGYVQGLEKPKRQKRSVPWLSFAACIFSFYMGRILSFNSCGSSLSVEKFIAPRVKNGVENDNDLLWELNMRKALSYSGITVPLNNGYSAKCIPENTMSQMNAAVDSSKLDRSKSGLSDGLPHIDDNLLDAGQVGVFASKNMKFNDEGQPIWTASIWDNFQRELQEGKDGGPPGYKNSGKSIMNAVLWVLKDTLSSCGAGDDGSTCHMSVFSAISPWAEALLFWSGSKLSGRNIRITSVDFNPCILDNIPSEAIAECLPTLDLVERSGHSFDLTVSYSGIEHDGLGRYGDPVNPNGDMSAMKEMWLLTRPNGILLVAVPCNAENHQPRSRIPIWGNGKIQVLQHRAYGAERYMRLIIGWELEGFVVNGGKVSGRKPGETKISVIARMLHCSFRVGEGQPLLILRRQDNMTFHDVLLEGDNWTGNIASQFEEDYNRLVALSSGNVTCT